MQNLLCFQVAVKNEKALNLYKSCGFEKKSTMDYYMVDKTFEINL